MGVAPKMGVTSLLIAAVLLLAAAAPAAASKAREGVSVTITPAASGRQLVRVSMPMPRGFLRTGQALEASDGRRKIVTALRALTWHPVSGREPRSVRRALVTFPYAFPDRQHVRFVLRPVAASKNVSGDFPARVTVEGERVTVAYRNGPTLVARMIAPARTETGEPKRETVESNACYLWQRFHIPDPQWPRIVEVRADALGGVVVVAHLQRSLPGDGRASDLGWDIEVHPSRLDRPCRLVEGSEERIVGTEERTHAFAEETPCALLLEDGGYRLYHPAAPFKRRGKVEAHRMDRGIAYRYLVCTEGEKVPMQQASWRRAEFVVSPSGIASLTPTLESPHVARVDWRLWEDLYGVGTPLDLARQPELAALLRYHHDAIVRAMAHGDDWGSVTGYSDGSRTGGAFGMNRLNHCAPIFEEGYRSGDRRLVETAVLWCDNFYDQSIWWGPEQTGGTRYNNVIAMGRTPPDNDRSYMWRSNSAVSFCTKGYDAFFYAYEQTGDPRMQEALDAQVAYAAKYLHAGRDYTRNVGDVRDFLHLYRYTGERRYLDEALRLFRELRTQLSTGDLFTESGKPIALDPPFIEEDRMGYDHPFAKPYIIGYALAGLPELARIASEEPKLRDVVRGVADFMAESQDPIGGWRYPHPRSSSVILSQAMEHAWQLAQADRLLGAQEKHLDAIERVLRQRLLGWIRTDRAFGGLTGWETATGKVKQASEIPALYKHPADRDITRDYTEGRPDFGSSAPEGIVYFPDVLAFYLKHRPASRLTAPPRDEEPLGKVLARVPGSKRP
jgi:hypothetical protein